MKTIAIIQARLASTRLPYKILRPMHGRPLLTYVVERVCAIPGLDMLGITTPEEDWPALKMCCVDPFRPKGISLFWAPHTPPDVLTGFHTIVKELNPKMILRVTGDCPLFPVDVALWIQLLFDFFPRPCEFAPDYMSTTRPMTSYPDGFDVEIFTRDALEIAHCKATGDDREHVTSFLWRQPDRFKIGRLTPLPDPWALGLKLSVDTQEDLDQARRIMAKIPAGDFSMAATLRAAKEIGC